MMPSGPVQCDKKRHSGRRSTLQWRRARKLLMLLTTTLWTAAVSEPAAGGLPSTLTVCPAGCGFSTIGAAIANADPGDTIRVLVQGTHTEGPIQVFKDITIEGLGESTTMVQQAPTLALADRGVFVVWLDATVTIRDMTIRHGRDDLGGCVFVLAGDLTLDHVTVRNCVGSSGGGILNRDRLTLIRSTVLEGTASEGGGIYNDDGAILQVEASVIELNEGFSGGGLNNRGIALILGSSIRDNQAQEVGGGIRNTSGGVLSVQTSSISGNSTGSVGIGGGVYHSSLVRTTISASTIADNSAAAGGGIYVDGPFDLFNSTISGNQVSHSGGGIAVVPPGDLRLASSTVTNNTADSDQDDVGNGGGILIDDTEVRISNTLIAGNIDASGLLEVRGPDCYGTLVSDGYNLIGSLGRAGPIPGTPVCHIDGVSTGNSIGVQAELDPLTANGGPTLTHALRSNSPAIDSGDPAGCFAYDGSALVADQRGFTRQNRCDRGAYERSAATPGLIFEDGFESENTWAWSSEVP